MESLLIQHWYYNSNQVLGSQPPTRRYHGRYHAPFFFGVFVAGAGQNRMTKKVAATKEEGIRNVHSHKQKMSNAECQGPHSQHKNSNCFTRWVVILSWVHIWSCFSQLLCGCMAELNHSKTPVLTFELLEVSFWTWDFVTHGNESNSPQHLGRRRNCHGNPFQFQGPFPCYIAHAAHGLCRLDHCQPSANHLVIFSDNLRRWFREHWEYLERSRLDTQAVNKSMDIPNAFRHDTQLPKNFKFGGSWSCEGRKQRNEWCEVRSTQQTNKQRNSNNTKGKHLNY